MNAFLLEVVKGLFTLTAVAVGSLVALRVYFRQKEYELTKQRYLEEGIDVVASEVEAALGIVSHNYARSLQLCKGFRDSKGTFQVSDLEKGYLPLDRSKFHQVAHHRIGALLGDEVVWKVYQSAMAYASSADSLIAQQIPEAVRILSGREEDLFNRATASEHMFAELTATHTEGFKYASLLRELHAVSLLLEAERLDLKAVARFRDRQDAKAVVARLKAEYEAELLPDESSNPSIERTASSTLRVPPVEAHVER